MDSPIPALKNAYDALASGELDSVLSRLDPAVEVHDHDRALDSPAIDHGHDGFVRMFAAANEGFEDVRFKPESFREQGSRVLVDVERSGRGEASGVSVSERQFHLFEFEDELVTKFSVFVDRDQAIAALTGTR